MSKKKTHADQSAKILTITGPNVSKQTENEYDIHSQASLKVFWAKNSPESQKTDAILREKEYILSESQRLAHIGSWWWDLKGPIKWTDETYRVYGVSQDIFRPTIESLVTLVHPDDQPAMGRWLEACRGGLSPDALEFRTILPDGSVRFISGTGNLLYDTENNPAFMAGTVQDITARKQAEQAVQDSERRFRAIFDQAPIAIALLDMQGHPTVSNLSLSKMVGYSNDELSTMTFTDFTYPEDADNDLNQFVELVEGRIPQYSMEKRYVHKNGNLVWANLFVTVLRNDAGTPQAIIGMAEDITERKKTEEALRESEEKFRLVFENAYDGISIYKESSDANQDLLVDCNPRYAEMAGRTREELIKLGNTAELTRLLSGYNRHSIAQDVAFRGSFSWIRPDRKDNIIEYTAAPITMAGKKFTIAIDRDITDRRRAEEDLSESERKYRDLVETANDLIWSVDGKGRITFMNQASRKIYGYAPEELLGRSYLDLLVPEERTRQSEIFMKLSANDEKLIRGVETEVVDRDGNHHTLVANAVVLYDQEGNAVGTMGTSTDITERKQAEEALRRSEQRLREGLDHLMEGCQIVGFDWRFLYLNDSAAHQGRKTKEEFLGRTMMEVLPGIEGTEMFATLRRAMEDRTMQHMENEFAYQDGSRASFELSIQPIEEGIFILSIDITERKRAEDEIRHKQAMLKRTEAVAHIGSWEWDVATDAVTWSDEMFRIVQRDPARGAPSFAEQAEIYHPEDMTHLKRVVEATVTDGVPYELELRAIRPNGETRICLAQGFAETGPGGKAVHLFGSVLDITERKLAEEALRHKEARQGKMVANIGDVIVIIDQDGINRYKSPNIERWFGWKAEEVVGASTWENVHSEDLDAAQKFIGTLLRKPNATGTTEVRYRCKDGSFKWIEFTGVNLLHDTDIRGILGNYHDITERKRAEEMLLESQKKFQALVETNSDVIWETDSGGSYTYCSPQAKTLWGIDPEEMLGKTPLYFVPSEDRERTIKVLSALSESASLFKNMEIRSLDAAGQVKALEISGAPFFDREGKLSGFRGVARDITERKQAEEKLRASEDKYRNLFNNAEVGMFRTRLDGSEVLEFNAKYLKILGYTVEEVKGTPSKNYWADTREREKMVQQLNAEGHVTDLECRMLNKQGEIVHCVTSLRVYREQGILEGSIVDITERKRVESQKEVMLKALREGADFLNESERIANMGSWQLNLANYKAHWSDNCFVLYGFTSHEIEPTFEYFKSRVHPDDVSIIENAFYAAVNNRQSNLSELRIVLPDGAIRWIQSNMEPVIENGQVVKLKGIQIDITDRKNAEKDLKESEFFFKESQRAGVIGSYRTDFVVGFWQSSDVLDNIFGIDKEYDRSVQGWLDIVHPDERALLDQYLREEVISKRKPFAREYRIVRKNDGATRWVNGLGEVDFDNDGNVVSMIGTIQDITERRQAEEALRKSESEFRSLAEAMPQIVWITRPDGWNIYFNQQWVEYTGLTLEESYGHGWNRPFHPDDQQRAWDAWQNAVSNNGMYSLECRLRRADGVYKWWLIRGVPVLDANGTILKWFGTCTDIHELKQAEDALRQAQKLESIGTLAGGIAHDFNNLLNAMMGQSALALGKLSHESPARNHIDKSIRAAERAADLTRQLLAYSGRGKFVTGEIDLNLLVMENIQLLQTSVPKSSEIRLELGSPPPHIQGDVGQIQQVVMNLIINAGEAMGLNPGVISVRTGYLELTQNDRDYWKYTTIPLAPGRYALLKVSDNGHGMKPEVLARIFDPFFTTKFTGRGLGLAAVLGIIKGHQGGIHITSEEGKGTRFDVVFPLVETSVANTVLEGTVSPVMNGEGKTILLIDDEPAVIELLTDICTEAKFSILSALNPMEGIELYRQHHRDITMVVLDYSMPDMDGKVAFNELITINKDVKVLLCSGYSEEEITAVFGEMQPAGFLEKPYQPSMLLERISRVLSE